MITPSCKIAKTLRDTLKNWGDALQHYICSAKEMLKMLGSIRDTYWGDIKACWAIVKKIGIC
jgi:hypothetical protein